MKLFTNRRRTDPSSLQHPESLFKFYDRVSGDYWDNVRSLLGGWFARYPPKHQMRLRTRLLATELGSFESAFWELYLHQFFICLGYQVLVDPELKQSNFLLTPDFVVEKAGRRTLVEAFTIHDSQSQSLLDRRIYEVVDFINRRVKSDRFALAIEVPESGWETPELNEVGNRIQGVLDSLRSNEILSNPAGAIVDIHSFEVLSRGWRIKLDVFRKGDFKTGDRIIIIGPSGSRLSGAFDDAIKIREVMRSKARKYGSWHGPLILAGLIVRKYTRDHDVQASLYGGIPISEMIAAHGTISRSNKGDWDGLWVTKRGPRNLNVSGVMSAVGLHPSLIASSSPTFWPCPWARTPLPMEFPIATRAVDLSDGDIDFRDATQSPTQIFELPTGWPGQRPFIDD